MRTCLLLRNLMFVDDLDLVNAINVEVVTGEVDHGWGVGFVGLCMLIQDGAPYRALIYAFIDLC